MRVPSPDDLTVDPETAALRILDVAASTTISVLMVFHPSVTDPECGRDRAHYLANRIIEEAHRLRHALNEYQWELDFQRGPLDDELTHDFADDDTPY
jgi:hypothetical protein